jgi:hypothetical protein
VNSSLNLTVESTAFLINQPVTTRFLTGSVVTGMAKTMKFTKKVMAAKILMMTRISKGM